MAFAAAVAVAYVLFEHYVRGTTVLGAVVQPVVLALLVTAVLFFPSRVDPLVPALQSQGILAAHVGFMIVAYGALSVSFGAAFLRLVQGEGTRSARLPAARLAPLPREGTTGGDSRARETGHRLTGWQRVAQKRN